MKASVYPVGVKIDPHRNKEAYFRWLERATPERVGLSVATFEVILQYLRDTEQGRNIAPGTKKGARSYIHVKSTKDRLVFLARHFERRFGCQDLATIREDQVHAFFGAMRSGEIRKSNGGAYRSTGDYVKVFKTFWHWHMRVQRRAGVVVGDICTELDDSRAKPPWVYLTDADVQRLCRHAKFEQVALMSFLFDAGLRAPTELVNIRVGDLFDDFRQLRIRDEVSKTFGRRIKILRCAGILKEYVRERKLQEGDQLFPVSPAVVNKYLKRLALRVLGDGMTLGGKRYPELSMYHFRHSSACFWLPRYKHESALKYRFGWKQTEEIHYYTEFIGMRDSITEEDLHDSQERTQLEQELATATEEKAILKEKLHAMDAEMKEIRSVVSRLVESPQQ